MRKIFSRLIYDIIARDRKNILIVGDIGHGLFTEVKRDFGANYLNIGICEQTMIGFASGLAQEDFIPWVYTITPFLIERPFEQVKLDIDQQNVNVKLVGYADYPTLGPTHRPILTKQEFSMFGNIVSYWPCSETEVCEAVNASSQNRSPAFISLRGL